jgi:hypothetical protein
MVCRVFEAVRPAMGDDTPLLFTGVTLAWSIYFFFKARFFFESRAHGRPQAAR